jgi:GT2 family glycosyltransferase
VQPSRPQVSICILTYNRCSLLRGLLTELTCLKYVPLEIIVVDNHSEDMTQTMMKQEFPIVTYIRTEENLGAAGRNMGMESAKGQIIITLDDDVTGLTDNALHILAHAFEGDRKLGAVNFRVINNEGHTCNWVHHCEEGKWFDKKFLTYEITEGAVAFSKEALHISGYYPKSFFLSHEGPDLAFRIFDRGFKVTYTGDVVVRHSFAQESREPWRNYYYDTRNQFWLAARNFPVSYAVAYLSRGLFSMLMYSLRDGYFIYWLRAVADGLKGLRQALKERKVLSDTTMDSIRIIDSHRPSLGYLIRNRLIWRKDLLFR